MAHDVATHALAPYDDSRGVEIAAAVLLDDTEHASLVDRRQPPQHRGEPRGAEAKGVLTHVPFGNEITLQKAHREYPAEEPYPEHVSQPPPDPSHAEHADISALLAAAGIVVTEEGKARARAKLDRARAQRTPEGDAALRRQLGLPGE